MDGEIHWKTPAGACSIKLIKAISKKRNVFLNCQVYWSLSYSSLHVGITDYPLTLNILYHAMPHQLCRFEL